jgi:hypothetical protein
MLSGLLRARRRRGRPPRRRIGCAGWLLVLLAVLVLLVILSVLFGGFQRGTKAGLHPLPGPGVAASTGTGAYQP